MSTVGNRVLAYLPTLHAPAQYTGSAEVTATLVVGTAEQVRVPFYCVQATVTAGPEIHFYRSTDGGANFATIAEPAIAISRAPNTTHRRVVTLDGGIYAIRMVAGGPSSATLGIETIEVVTAYIGV